MYKAVEYLRLLERKCYIIKKKIRLTNTTPTIIASNCVGTLIYSDLKLPFRSPTINLWIEMNDFVRFAEKLEWYLEQPLYRVEDDSVPYPVGMLGNIKLYFMHYDSWDQAILKWKTRSRRIDLNNLFFIGCEKNGCTYETIKRFDNLPYRNKVIFTKKGYPEFSSAFHIHGFEEQEEMGNLINFRKNFLLRRYMEDFDYVAFLNGLLS